MTEFLPGTHDKAAAEKEFLEIFKDADKKVKGELFKHFLKGFRRGYKSEGNTQKCWELSFKALIERKFSAAQEDNATYSGVALGSFLIGMEWYVRDRGTLVDRYTKDLLVLATKIASELKGSNKSVKPKFIKNRILVIARKNAGKISIEKQRFVAQVASLFM